MDRNSDYVIKSLSYQLPIATGSCGCHRCVGVSVVPAQNSGASCTHIYGSSVLKPTTMLPHIYVQPAGRGYSWTLGIIVLQGLNAHFCLKYQKKLLLLTSSFASPLACAPLFSPTRLLMDPQRSHFKCRTAGPTFYVMPAECGQQSAKQEWLWGTGRTQRSEG